MSALPRRARVMQRGFTLLEVIAAILLLGLAFTVLMRVAGGAIGLTAQAADASAAAMWARSKLDSAFVMEPLQPGTTQGRFDERFGWQLQVTPWQGEGVRPAVSVLQLYQLDLTVTWGATAHPRVAHFRTLRLGAGSAAGAGLSP